MRQGYCQQGCPVSCNIEQHERTYPAASASVAGIVNGLLSRHYDVFVIEGLKSDGCRNMIIVGNARVVIVTKR